MKTHLIINLTLIICVIALICVNNAKSGMLGGLNNKPYLEQIDIKQGLILLPREKWGRYTFYSRSIRLSKDGKSVWFVYNDRIMYYHGAFLITFYTLSQ